MNTVSREALLQDFHEFLVDPSSQIKPNTSPDELTRNYEGYSEHKKQWTSQFGSDIKRFALEAVQYDLTRGINNLTMAQVCNRDDIRRVIEQALSQAKAGATGGSVASSV